MIVQPRLQLSGTEQMEDVHRYSIQILEDTGLKVESKEALKVFKNSDGVKVEGHTVFLQGELINHDIDLAPSNIDLYNKKGEPAFQLGSLQGSETYFGIGYTKGLVKMFSFIIMVSTLSCLLPYLFSSLSELAIYVRRKREFSRRKLIAASLISLPAFLYSLRAIQV